MAGESSRENGKKGGRPKAPHTIEAEAARAFIIAQIMKNLAPLVGAMIRKAIKGDVQAFRELFDRGPGRPPQAVDLTSGGKPLLIAQDDDE